MKNKFLLAIFVLLAISCKKDPVTDPGSTPGGGDKPQEEFKIPEAPETAVESNTFVIEYFLSLPSESAISDHILNSKDKRPLLYIFDKVTYTPNQSNALVQAAISSKCYPFFTQAGATSYSGNRGTGFLTRYTISEFDGECAGTPFGGPMITTSLKTIINLRMYNCNCSTPKEFTSVVESRKNIIYGDAVTVGIYGGDAQEMKEISESKVLSMRFDYFKIGDKVIFSAVQPGYVNRGFEKKSLGGVDYIRIFIEKLY